MLGAKSRGAVAPFLFLDRTLQGYQFWQLGIRRGASPGGEEPPNLKVKFFFHNKCFDGTASAALFSRFYRERIDARAEFEFAGLLHRAGALFCEDDFTG